MQRDESRITRHAFHLGMTILIGGFLLAVPLITVAASASAEAILRAVDEARAANLCSEEVKAFGSDCEKTTVSCGPTNEWERYVAEHYQLVGSTVQGKDGGAGTVTPAVSALDYLRADWERNKAMPPGPVEKGTCYCECRNNDNTSACQGKVQGTPFRLGEELALTREECTARCAPRPIAQKCAGTIAPVAAADAPASNFQGDMCFTSAECGAQGGVFAADSRCPGQGLCYAAEPIIKLNTQIGSVTHIQGFNTYVVTAYRYLLTIVGVVATIMFVWGAFLFLVGSALPSIQKGKTIMMDAVVGLLLVLGATTILRTINPATTTLDPLKVPLVNAIQFVNAAYCSDLPGNPNTAPAGVRPALQPYEEVAKQPNAFSVPAQQTLCGTSYWVENTIGSACEGRTCSTSGEACVSCADGAAPGCQGRASTAMVCDRTILSGTIRYANQRVPEQVSLLFLCGFAEASAMDQDPFAAVAKNWWIEEETTPTPVGFRVAGRVTDTDDSGVAGFRIEFDEAAIDRAVALCAFNENGNTFRGALLGVQYNDDTVASNIRGTASLLLKITGVSTAIVPPVGAGLYIAGEQTGGYASDDFAVLSKADCGGGRRAFAGYDTGETSLGTEDTFDSDHTDLTEGILCGLQRGRLQDGPNTYWKTEDLRAAANGTHPIVCDFTLDSETAPSNPGRVCEE